MTRKPPVRHKVRSHSREGKLIQSFERGVGQKSQRSSRSKPHRVIGKTMGQTKTKIETLAKEYVQKHYQKVGLKEKPRVWMTEYSYPLTVAKVVSGGRIRYNFPIWSEYFNIDYDKAAMCLEFATVHEMFHIKKAQDRHRSYTMTPSPIEEQAANLDAQILTGFKVKDTFNTFHWFEIERERKQIRGSKK